MPAAMRDSRDLSREPHLPHTQAPMPAATSAARRAKREAAPDSESSTEAIHTTAAIMGKPMACFRLSIHLPGRGMRFTRPGAAESAR